MKLNMALGFFGAIMGAPQTNLTDCIFKILQLKKCT